MPVRRTDNLDQAESAILAAVSTGLMEAVQSEKQNIEENWDRNRDALGRPWQELSPRTILNKGHASILEESGEMRDSVFARRKGPFSVEVGVADPKVQFHEHGTETIPPRPVVQPAKTHLRTGALQSQLARRIGAAIIALNLRAALG